MESRNVDLVRSIYAAWERGDFGSAEWAKSEIEYVHVGDGPAPGTWRGQPGMAEAVRSWVSAWHDYRIEAEEYREIDEEHVLVLAHQAGRGKRSGLEMQSEAASLFQMRCGKVTRLAFYTSHDRALADLGLAPGAGRTDP